MKKAKAARVSGCLFIYIEIQSFKCRLLNIPFINIQHSDIFNQTKFQFNSMKKCYIKNLRRISIAAGLSLLLGAPSIVHAQNTNLGFSSGNFSNWTCWVGQSIVGTAATGTALGSPTITAPIGGNAPGPGTTNKSRHAITSGVDTDYYGGFPIVCPAGGSYSVRIGNDSTGAHGERIQYRIHVPTGTTSFNIQCQFAVVLEEPGHSAAEQPTFQLVAYDSASGTVLPAANNLYVSQGALPGFSMFVDPVTHTTNPGIIYLPWTATTINLSGSAGKTVILECTVLGCSPSGHFGYGYFDVTGTSDSLIAQPIMYNQNHDSVLLEGPAGYKYYHWYNQNFSKELNAWNEGEVARKKMLPIPASSEYYNLVLTPYSGIGVADTIQSPVLRVINNVGVGNLSWTKVNIYPNPATTDLNISFPSAFEGTVSLFSVTGERIYNERINVGSSHSIQTAAFATGIYNLVLKDSQGNSIVKKVSVKH
jgi:hypothetical protein